MTPTRPQRGVVLVVDDHEPARYVKTRILREAGYDVHESASGIDALRFVAEQQPALVVLDIKLPGIDGFEVCRRLRANPATTSIAIVHTSASFTQADDRARGLEDGADAYLTAPIDPRVMLATIGTLMRARLAENALRESEQRFRTMADAAPVMIWTSDAKRRIAWLNRAWLEFTGSTLAAELDGGWQQRMHPEDAVRRAEAFARAFEAREPFQCDYRVRDGAGRYRQLVDRGAPLYDSAQVFLGYVGSCVDDTERRAAEEERARLLASERAARMEAERLNRTKDEFLATLSHELRTPLNAILGWSQLLRHDELDPEELRQGVKTIERNARAQARIIEDLLDMSRIIAGKVHLEIQDVDVGDIALAAIESVSLAAMAKGIAVERSIHGPARLAGDPNRLQQIVWNLLTNAIKFTPRGGRVTVTVRTVKTAPAGDSIEIEVRDDGQGVSAQMLPHLFERFWQADASTARPHGGLGIGLAIVKNLVELHGGNVTADSEGANRGTTFRVLLPLAVERRATESAAPPVRRDELRVETLQPARRPSLKGVRVLVVDDDTDGRLLLQRLLREHDAHVVSAASGAEALAKLERDPADVLISDIGMPGLDGYALIRQVRAQVAGPNAKIPAIALTAFARAEDRRQALDAGYQAHLAKPVEVRELVSAVARLAERSTAAPDATSSDDPSEFAEPPATDGSAT